MIDVINNNLLDIIVEDVISDECISDLDEVIFSIETSIDYYQFANLLKNRYGHYSNKLNDEEKKCVSNYLSNIKENVDELDFLIFLIEKKLLEENTDSLSEGRIIALEFKNFWMFFSIACKKCIDDPIAKFVDHTGYFERFIITTEQQKKACAFCLEGFELDSDHFSRKKTYNLDLFLHSIRSNKTMRKKKKNIHRVLKQTKKIMRINKMAHRNRSFNIFMGKTYLIPDQFVNIVINDFID